MSDPGALVGVATGRHDPAAVVLQDVGFTYPGAGLAALASVSLTIQAGEAVAVVGESGSGKSTLARLMVGALRAGTGSVRAGGMDAAGAPRHEVAAYAGLVFQNPNHQLFASTVRDELALGPRNIGLGGREIKDRVEETARRLDIEPYLNDHPYRLGLANRKRVAIAAVLAMRPRVLVLDEPTTGQGRREVSSMTALLREETAAGTTVIVISHDMRFTADVARRVVVLGEGRVRADGPVRAVITDEALLGGAGLEPPQVTRLARRLGLALTDGPPLTMDEMLSLLSATRTDGATTEARP
jgi:energy-coupling factor transporter ATP-binding protein EcfA2